MEKEKKFTTRQFVEMALLTGIILLLAFTPLGYIRTFGLEITLIVVPVTVGGGGHIGTACRRSAWSGIWDYEFPSVFWHEPVWNSPYGDKSGCNIYRLRCFPCPDGLADGSFVSGV